MTDFDRCTPSEFEQVYANWKNMEERREQRDWEVARMQCLCSLQPYSKRRMTARDVMEFPWERDDAREEASPDVTETPDREEMLRRFENAKRRYGLR